MPYIKQERRKELDKEIDKLIENAKAVGELNYIITKLLYGYICKYAGVERLDYSACNAIIGVLECVKQEFYRRVMSSYESKKMLENGDVY